MTGDLAQSIDRYFASEAIAYSDGMAEYCSPDAVVHDEDGTHRGIAAIEAWKTAAKAKSAYTVRPLSAKVDGDCTLVSAEVARFLGSPVTLTYIFTIANDRIADLDNHP